MFETSTGPATLTFIRPCCFRTFEVLTSDTYQKRASHRLTLTLIKEDRRHKYNCHHCKRGVNEHAPSDT